MSDLLTNRFISHNQSLKAKVLSKSRSGFSRAKDEPFFDVRTCQPDEAFRTRWTEVKSRAVQKANEELKRWRKADGTRITEKDPEALPLLRKYWAAVGMRPSDRSLPSKSWSAVFISYLMREAGAGDFFAYDPLHMVYVHAAKQNAVSRVMENPFWLCNINNALPEPGDLICMNQPGSTRITYDNVRPEGGSHCDIVVSVDYTTGILRAIGGNAGRGINTVAYSRNIRLNDDGTINTTLHPGIYAVLKLRTDKCQTCGTSAVV